MLLVDKEVAMKEISKTVLSVKCKGLQKERISLMVQHLKISYKETVADVIIRGLESLAKEQQKSSSIKEN